MNKRHKEIAILLVALVGIGGVLAYTFLGSPSVPPSAYAPQVIDTDLEAKVLENPEYRDLVQPVPLPVKAVPTGRENPYLPF